MNTNVLFLEYDWGITHLNEFNVQFQVKNFVSTLPNCCEL